MIGTVRFQSSLPSDSGMVEARLSPQIGKSPLSTKLKVLILDH
jgi:hypothetical protein